MSAATFRHFFHGLQIAAIASRLRFSRHANIADTLHIYYFIWYEIDEGYSQNTE
jgi:hypothetical protein